MADYTLSQIRAMQEEATRRVQEMNRRNKTSLGSNTREPEHFSNNARKPEHFKEPFHKKEEPPISTQKQDKSGGILPLNFLKNFDIRSLLKDTDQSLILVLIILLAGKEDTDTWLLMALLYILL